MGITQTLPMQCNTLVMVESLMVKKNSGARAEFLALICFILEPEPSFLAMNFYFGARAKFYGSGIFLSRSQAVKACHLRLELT